jgi:hypothetical protein
MPDKWDRKEKLMVAGTVLTLAGLLISAFFIYKQMKLSNALTMKAALENQAHEFTGIKTIHPAISCVYVSKDKAIDDECSTILRKPANRRLALMYVSSILSFFGKVKTFSQECDREYINDFHGWMDEVGSADITSYFLFINEMDSKTALKVFGISVNDADIRSGYLRFKKQMHPGDSEP